MIKLIHCQVRLPKNLSDLSFRVPDSLEDLKFVLKTINDIKDMSLEVEFQYLDIKERYRTLDMYSIPVSVLGLMSDDYEFWENELEPCIVIS